MLNRELSGILVEKKTKQDSHGVPFDEIKLEMSFKKADIDSLERHFNEIYGEEVYNFSSPFKQPVCWSGKISFEYQADFLIKVLDEDTELFEFYAKMKKFEIKRSGDEFYWVVFLNKESCENDNEIVSILGAKRTLETTQEDGKVNRVIVPSAYQFAFEVRKKEQQTLF